MKTNKKYEVEHIRPMCDHKTSIKRLTGDISGRYGHFVETIWNSHEHGGAKHIWITITGRGSSYEVTIIDDGKGMDSYRRQRSLNMAMIAEVQTGRNYQDLGLKRLAADFQRAKVLTVSAEEKEADDDFPMWVMEYDFDTLFDILATNAEETITAKPRRPDWEQMGLPVGSTGVKIHLTGARDGRPHVTADKLRRELPNCLPPKIANKVYINGQPLEQRQIVGEPFRMTIDDHPKLGRVDLDLYIPKVKSTRDRLMVGPFEGISEWRAFIQEIPEEISGDRLNILSDGVFGEIHVEAFKGFVTASRRDFEVTLFAKPLISHFVDFMEHEVCAELEHLLGMIKQTEVSERDKRLLTELTKYISVLGGDEEKRRHRFSVLTLDATSIEVLPNQRQPVEIRVDKYNTDLTIAWNTSACGGRTEISHDGRQVKYWSGAKVGGYDLVSYYEEEPKTKAKVDISIVSQKLLRVHPQRVTVHPGRTVILTGVNWEDDSSGAEHLRWRRATDDAEGRFIMTVRSEKQEREVGYGSVVVYRAGDKLGTYRIELYDNKNRRKLAHTDVTVAKPPEREKGGKDDENDVIIEGTRYQVGFEYMEAYPGMSRLYSGSGKKQIRINRCHPGCKHAEKRRGDDGLLELALGQLLLQHIDEQSRATGEQLTMEEKTRRFADLYAAIVMGYERREQ